MVYLIESIATEQVRAVANTPISSGVFQNIIYLPVRAWPGSQKVYCVFEVDCRISKYRRMNSKMPC